MAACLKLDSLDEFLAQERMRKWCWRDVNCAFWVADWIRSSTGIDPARDMRGQAASADEWYDVIKRRGGFMPIIGAAMDGHWLRTQSPGRGDVGIVSVPVALCNRLPVVGAIAGICMAPATANAWPMFVCRSLRGLYYERLAMVTAWRLTWHEQTMH